MIKELLDLDRYPIDRLDSPEGERLIDRCKADMAANGMFNLQGLVKPGAVATAVSELDPLIDSASYRHARRHNIYFKKDIPGLAPDHPALRQFETVNYPKSSARGLSSHFRFNGRCTWSAHGTTSDTRNCWRSNPSVISRR